MVGFGMFDYGANDPVSTAREAGKSLTAARREVESRGIKDFLFLSSSPEEFDQRVDFGGVSGVLAEVADKYLGSSEQRAKLTAALRREFVAAQESKVAQHEDSSLQEAIERVSRGEGVDGCPLCERAKGALEGTGAFDAQQRVCPNCQHLWHDSICPGYRNCGCDGPSGDYDGDDKFDDEPDPSIDYNDYHKSKVAQQPQSPDASGAEADAWADDNKDLLNHWAWHGFSGDHRVPSFISKYCDYCNGTKVAPPKPTQSVWEGLKGLLNRSKTAGEFVAQQPRDPQEAKEKAKELTHPGTIRGHESLNKSNRNESAGSFSEQIVNEPGDSPKERGKNEKRHHHGSKGASTTEDDCPTCKAFFGQGVQDFCDKCPICSQGGRDDCPDCKKFKDDLRNETLRNDLHKDSSVRKEAAVVLCPTCKGEGQHVNSGVDYNGLSDEDVNDPDFMEDYMGGAYDVPCAECGGNNVVPKCTQCDQPAESKPRGYGDRRDSVSTDHYSTCYEHLPKEEKEDLRETADYYAEMEAERRMGA